MDREQAEREARERIREIKQGRACGCTARLSLTYQNILHHQKHLPFPASSRHPPKFPA